MTTDRRARERHRAAARPAGPPPTMRHSMRREAFDVMASLAEIAMVCKIKDIDEGYWNVEDKEIGLSKGQVRYYQCSSD